MTAQNQEQLSGVMSLDLFKVQTAPYFTVVFGAMPPQIYVDPVNRQCFQWLQHGIQQRRMTTTWAMHKLQYRLSRTFVLEKGGNEWRKQHIEINNDLERLIIDTQTTHQYLQDLQNAYVKFEWVSRLDVLNERLCNAYREALHSFKRKRLIIAPPEAAERKRFRECADETLKELAELLIPLHPSFAGGRTEYTPSEPRKEPNRENSLEGQSRFVAVATDRSGPEKAEGQFSQSRKSTSANGTGTNTT